MFAIILYSRYIYVLQIGGLHDIHSRVRLPAVFLPGVYFPRFLRMGRGLPGSCVGMTFGKQFNK